MGKVFYKKSALKFLEKHKKENIVISFKETFRDLSLDWGNFSKIYDIKPMRNKKALEENFKLFRLRIGKYRALFELNDKFEIIIVVIEIDSRGDIYK